MTQVTSAEVKTALIADCGHCVIADQPNSVADLIEKFAGAAKQ
jgi:hypothetical protein